MDRNKTARIALGIVGACIAAIVAQLPALAGATTSAEPTASSSAIGSASATPRPGGTGCSRDLDCDGMPNRWERRYGLDPHRNDSRGDPDHDHLANLSEFLNGGNPTVPDTDIDGLRDGREVHFFHTRVDVADAIVGKVTGIDQCPTGAAGAYACPVLSLFDATVVLRDSDGNEVARTTSDFAGRFNFTLQEAPPGVDPPGSTYRLEAQPLLGFAAPAPVNVTTSYDVAQRVPRQYSNSAPAGVAGQVTESPTCGGPQRRDEGCVAVLAGAQIDIEDAGGNVIASTTSGDDGRYVVPLDAGTYSVVARAPDGSFPMPPAPVQITVTETDRGPNHVDLDYSTGIL